MLPITPVLTELTIRHFAIIDRLRLELSSGLSVLTGETGAGKSIMFDALELALGGRAERTVVRAGQTRAEVVARFDISAQPALQAQLEEYDIDRDDELLLRRIVGSDGRSRAYINGSPAPVAMLRRLGSQLVEIHGQHEHQTLGERSKQLELLDAFAGSQPLLAELKMAYEQWQTAQRELESLRAEVALSPAELELLRYQRDELGPIAEHAATLDELHAEQQRLANAGSLIEAADSAWQRLDGDSDHNARSLLASAARTIDEHAELDPKLSEAASLLNGALIQTEEAAAALNQYRDQVDLDGTRLDEVENLLSSLHDAARKHRVETDDLPQKLHELDERLARAADAEQLEETLSQNLAKAADAFVQLAKRLSARRLAAASTLSDQITELMQQLGMAGGQFEIGADFNAERPFRPTGLDEITFMVSANPGQPLQPLSKVASGGELARIGLSVKVALVATDEVGTLIFDEVDAGVGGAIAQIVGEKLRAVGNERQVFCITHLPQVAACGHQHLKVAKSVDDDQTSTTVEALNKKARVDEIARMLGGVEITAKTTAHASEMIRSAQT